jgi:hypothetical protein
MVAAVFALALLLVGGGKAQAVIGIPDDVPGATVLFPFFKVNPTPSAATRQDSLIVVTNTGNPSAVLGSARPPLASGTAATWIHITIWTVKSEHVVDFSVRLTEHDVWSCSLLDLLVNPTNAARPCGVNQAPPIVLTALRVGDILAGYVTADVVTGPTSLFPGEAGYPFQDWNVLIGHLYLVDLPAGSATGFNATSIEAATNVTLPAGLGRGYLGHPAVAPAIPAAATAAGIVNGFYLNRCIESQGQTLACDPLTSPIFYGNRERIDGYAGDAQQTESVTFTSATDDSPLSMIVRYFTLSSLNASSEIWLWKDRVTATTSLTFAVYDEDENVQSVSFAVGDEVNFTSTKSIISPSFPGGWLRIKFTCGGFGYCTYVPGTPSTWRTGTTFNTPIQSVAYSLQFANSQAATLRWDAAFPAHRQYTNFIGGVPGE